MDNNKKIINSLLDQIADLALTIANKDAYIQSLLETIEKLTNNLTTSKE